MNKTFFVTCSFVYNIVFYFLAASTIKYTTPMKLRFLFFTALLSLASCSDNYVPKETKQLKNVITYHNDGDREVDVKTAFYNDLPSRRYTYKDGEDFATELFTYDANTMYMSGYHYFQQDRQNSVDKSIYYDDDGKIESIYIYDYTPLAVIYNKTYDYSIPGEITMHQQKDDGGTIITKQTLYNLNSIGNIYKITSFDEDSDIEYIEEAEYLGDILTSVITTDYQNGIAGQENIVNYNYDTSTEVKGAYLNLDVSQFGTSNNSVLFYNGFEVFKENYLVKKGNTTLEYEFDRDSFPARETLYVDNVMSQENIITYQ